MYVACSTLCFSSIPLPAALRTIREMHFAKADLAIHESGSHLRPSQVLADVARAATQLKGANVAFAAFHLEFAEFDDETTRHQLRAVCRLARTMAVPLVTVVAAPLGTDAHAEAGRLKAWAKIAEAEGVILTVETRVGTLAEDVSCAAELCRRVPGLGITLDPSHFTTRNQTEDGCDPLYPFVKHVRLRDSGNKPDQFQLRIGQGSIEYGRIIGQLDRCRYDRALSVDIRDLPGNPFPVEPEIRKLKHLLESQV